MIIINQSPKVRSINEKLDRTDHSLDSLICFGKFHRKPFLALTVGLSRHPIVTLVTNREQNDKGDEWI